MVFCPNCGHENNGSAKFCKNCGASLKPNNPIKEDYVAKKFLYNLTFL